MRIPCLRHKHFHLDPCLTPRKSETIKLRTQRLNKLNAGHPTLCFLLCFECGCNLEKFVGDPGMRRGHLAVCSANCELTEAEAPLWQFCVAAV